MYSGYELDSDSRNILVQRFPFRFPDILGNHVTYNFGSKILPPPAYTAYIVGYQSILGLEVLVVAINGTVYRIDGMKYHITWSLDRNKDFKPVHSNDMLEEKSYNIISPIEIELVPKVFK